MREKKFTEWICLKEKLHKWEHFVPNIQEADLWWVSFGENIGYEIDGKSRLFTRPAIVLKRLAKGFYYVVPTSTQKRTGSWYVDFKQNDIEMVACLQQARPIDYRRFSSQIGALAENDFVKVKDGFKKLYFP